MASNKNELLNNISKNTLAESSGDTISAGFAALMGFAGIPEALFLTPIVRGTTIGIVSYCYDEFIQRRLSKRESQKVENVTKIALQTYYELAEKDEHNAMVSQFDDSQLKYAYEVSENLMLTAIRQSEQTKVEILGRYYGRQFYKGNIDWQDMHQMITMASSLTLRQLVMIRLIADDFKGLNSKSFISNPSACVEINRLLNYGIWQKDGAAFSINDSIAPQLVDIISTPYSKEVSEALMLDRLSEEDIQRTIDSLNLKTEGTSEEVLTADDYKKHTVWQKFDENGDIELDTITPEDIDSIIQDDILKQI